MEATFAIAALAVSLMAFVFPYFEVRRQSTLAATQNDLQLHQTRLQRDLDIVRWAQETIDILTAAWSLAREVNGPKPLEDLKIEASRITCELSASIEKGRLYLPNVEKELYRPTLMPESRRGYRHAALDELVDAFERIEAFRTQFTVLAVEELFENRRWFVDAVVGEIQDGLHFAVQQRVTQRQIAPEK